MRKLVSWVEIPAVDFERAVSFYQEILETEFKIGDYGDEKMACFPSDDGAISFAPDFKPSREGTLVSLSAVNSLDICLERVVKKGGEIIQPKTKIEAEGRAYFAIIIDCEGNKIGLYGN